MFQLDCMCVCDCACVLLPLVCTALAVDLLPSSCTCHLRKWTVSNSAITAILIIIQGQFRIFDLFFGCKLVLKTVGSPQLLSEWQYFLCSQMRYKYQYMTSINIWQVPIYDKYHWFLVQPLQCGRMYRAMNKILLSPITSLQC